MPFLSEGRKEACELLFAVRAPVFRGGEEEAKVLPSSSSFFFFSLFFSPWGEGRSGKVLKSGKINSLEERKSQQGMIETERAAAHTKSSPDLSMYFPSLSSPPYPDLFPS